MKKHWYRLEIGAHEDTRAEAICRHLRREKIQCERCWEPRQMLLRGRLWRKDDYTIVIKFFADEDELEEFKEWNRHH